MIRRFSATWVFTLHTTPLKNGIVEVDADGVVVDVIDTGGKLREYDRMEHHSGIIIPGFVNAHCHLELSHLKGMTSGGKGLMKFLGDINLLRAAEEERTLKAAARADLDMYRNGVSVCGDVSNSSLTVDIKRKSSIRYVNFIETFGFHPSRASRAMENALDVWKKFDDASLSASVVPHAPYSVSAGLFKMIGELEDRHCSILSIHNQESQAENRFFRKGDGPVRDHFINNLGLDPSHWIPTGKNSLESVIHYLSGKSRLLLVHNTYTGLHDLEQLKKAGCTNKVYLVLCPAANLCIENRLPPIGMFRNEGLNICLGTDSLASNAVLSPLHELYIIQQNFPGIGLQELLTWACLNGARALNLDETYGTIEKGKKPGLILIKGIDWSGMKLIPASKVLRLV